MVNLDFNLDDLSQYLVSSKRGQSVPDLPGACQRNWTISTIAFRSRPIYWLLLHFRTTFDLLLSSKMLQKHVKPPSLQIRLSLLVVVSYTTFSQTTLWMTLKHYPFCNSCKFSRVLLHWFNLLTSIRYCFGFSKTICVTYISYSNGFFFL